MGIRRREAGRARARGGPEARLPGPGVALRPGPAGQIPPGKITAATAAAGDTGVIHGPPETVTVRDNP